ncbi:MAG: hypothetical protein QF464_24030, partial [Myxococcota bacterium]|nr:hypothetical protein [Myxococcota bacterium]
MLAYGVALLAITLVSFGGCSDTDGDGGVCTPSCGERVCGEDGCGSVCGSCTGTDLCSGLGVCMAPAECTDTCESVSASCGTVCGEACGSCATDQSCAGVTCIERSSGGGGGGFATGEA